MLKNCFLLLLAVNFIACGSMQHVVPQKPVQTAIPTLTALTDTGSVALKITKMDVSVMTVGNVSETVFDLTFYNDMDRVLEGEFDFPLLDGQNISKYALEVNGELREGVVVEKAKARVAYENTVRRGVDPGLVEKTKGNNFRTRIYPIPAKGYKRVVIGLEELLSYNGNGYLYRLPLYSRGAIDSFNLSAKVKAFSTAPVLEGNELSGFQFKESGSEYNGRYSKQHLPLNQLFGFLLPFDASSSSIIATESWKDNTYCYASCFTSAPLKQRKKPGTVAVLWDISSSAKNRNEEKEKQLLRKYLEQTGDVKLILVPFNIRTEDQEIFEIRNGNSEALINEMNAFEKEGGTQLGAINLEDYVADEYIIFSDGISTFGKKEIHYGNKPVIAVNSSPSADISYLKFIAGKTNGRFIDLVKEEPEVAVQQIQTNSLHIVNYAVTEGKVEDLVFRPQQHSLGLACILKTAKAVIDVSLGYSEEDIVEKKQFVLSTGVNPADNVKRTWASMKIEELDLEYEKHKDEITSLGKTFSIVTRNTSLIVLDRVEDYVQYEIVPPASLQKQYYALLKEKRSVEAADKNIALEEALDAMQELKDWWNRNNYKTSMLKFTPPVVAGNTEVVSNAATTVVPNTQATADSTVPVGAYRNFATSERKGESANANAVDFYAGKTEEPQAHLAPPHDGDGVEDRYDDKVKEIALPKPGIELQQWSADASYLKKLKEAKTENRLNAYRQAKKEFGMQPAFYADAAGFFFANDDREMALLILSNIAEMKLEDPELLRTMAYHLMDMNEIDLAIETFKEVKGMREEEPQSYRDLALAYNESGNYNEALKELNAVLKGTWDERFGRVKSIALSELNAIISAHHNPDVSAIDPRFIYAMPVDVRIVIGWSANDSDIDLWVTDPGHEKCFYQNKETSTGGRISDDMTQGYGPEEFMVRRASKGKYIVEANLFGDHRQTLGGPLTITAELFTDFGKPTQKRRTINFRVTEARDVVKIGELSF